MRSILLAAGLALAIAGCQKPEPPRLTPKEARVVALSPQGLDVLVKVEALNPNRMTLSAQAVTGKAKIDGKYELASVTITRPITLPPSTPTMIDVPMTLAWVDPRAVASLAATAKEVPYVFEGTVRVGGERLNVDLPFSMTGTISREQILAAALKGLPALPGWRPPPP